MCGGLSAIFAKCLSTLLQVGAMLYFNFTSLYFKIYFTGTTARPWFASDFNPSVTVPQLRAAPTCQITISEGDSSAWSDPLTYSLLVLMISTVLLETHYLATALEGCDAMFVIPAFQVSTSKQVTSTREPPQPPANRTTSA